LPSFNILRATVIDESGFILVAVVGSSSMVISSWRSPLHPGGSSFSPSASRLLSMTSPSR
jgi:hypothetical protein